ncbi:Nucleoporin nup85 [Podochytrium sp. JEL0797]|nr:Nucleoporin nup85 [Podochytrium sp. JEL0797]
MDTPATVSLSRFPLAGALVGETSLCSSRTSLVTSSQGCRAHLSAQVSRIDALLPKHDTDPSLFEKETTDLAHDHHALRLAHSLWLLAESLLLNPNDSSLPQRLLDWINNLESKPTQAHYTSLLETTPFPSSNPSFWPYIHKCLLRGHFYAAASMLQKHESYPRSPIGPADKPNVFASLVQLITTMPKLSSNSLPSTFSASWAQWHRSVAAYKDPARLRTVFALSDSATDEIDALAACFGIMAADVCVLAETSAADEESVHTWMEAFVALVWYTDPCASITSLSNHLDAIKPFFTIPSLEDPEEGDMVQDEEESSDPPMKAFEYAVTALVELQIDTAVLKYAPQVDFMAAVHLIHILHQLGRMDDAEGVEGFVYFSGEDAMRAVSISEEDTDSGVAAVGLRDSYWLEYASRLSQTSEYELIATQYLSLLHTWGCEVAARKLSQLLLNMDVSQHPAQLRKLVSIARANGLQDVVKVLYKRLGKERDDRKRFGESIDCYVTSGNLERASVVADKVLHLHLKHTPRRDETGNVDMQTAAADDINTHQIVSQFSSTAVSSVPLTAVLTTLESLHNTQDPTERGAAILELLTHLATPKWVWPRLLVDCVSLLEREEKVFGVQDTFEVMRCLEVVVESGVEWTGVGVGGEEEGVVGVDVVRLAVSRNLARAMMAV